MKLKLPHFTKNFYFLTGAFFIIWLLFVDSNDVVSQIKLKAKVSELEGQKEYYQKNIEELSGLYELRENNIDFIEKYAREKYLMKKESEDIFVIVEK
ncbi:MAG: septum formation initiator family protein [Cyclobacteriaceae bacterium]|nr:septum formation initiator family protein [Cyclobacteriaceae bacterium]